MKVVTKCKKCDEWTAVDTSVVLTSHPPQYGYTCEHCGERNCCYTHEVEYIPEKNYELKAYIDANLNLSSTTYVCKHSIDVKMVNGDYVSFCTKCGAIFETKSSWHY